MAECVRRSSAGACNTIDAGRVPGNQPSEDREESSAGVPVEALLAYSYRESQSSKLIWNGCDRQTCSGRTEINNL